jgi:hypothetical protein
MNLYGFVFVDPAPGIDTEYNCYFRSVHTNTHLAWKQIERECGIKVLYVERLK